jgi:hypothetical protein
MDATYSSSNMQRILSQLIVMKCVSLHKENGQFL